MTGDELLEFVDRKLFPALRNLDLSTSNQRAVIVREVFEGNNNFTSKATVFHCLKYLELYKKIF